MKSSTHQGRRAGWRRALAPLFVALSLVVVAACGGAADTATTTTVPADAGPPARTDIVVATMQDITTTDMTATGITALARPLFHNVYEALVQEDANGQLAPMLAHAWDISEDGTVYTFQLRDDVTFHDGTPFGADTVVWTLERAMNDEATPFGEVYGLISSVTQVDDYTVEVELSRPSAQWLIRMAGSPGVMINEESYARLAEHPVGTGPYVFDEWIRGDSISFVRNDDYWGEVGPIEKATFRFIEDENATINALLAGDVDFAMEVAAKNRLNEFDDRWVIATAETDVKRAIALNVVNPPLDDIRVRQAIHHAIDKAAILEATEAGFGYVTGIWAGPSDPYYFDYEPYPYDPDRARELLIEAGYPDGVDITHHTIRGNQAQFHSEVVVPMLEEVGFNVELIIEDIAVIAEQIWSVNPTGPDDSNYHMLATGHGGPMNLFRFVIGDGPWFMGYMNQEFRDYVIAADTSATPEELVENAQAALRILADDAVVVTMFSRTDVNVYAAGLNGWQSHRPGGAALVLRTLSWDAEG